jgi:hypothetical protein
MTTTQDKNGAKVDLGLLEEDDEFEEFPADGKLNFTGIFLVTGTVTHGNQYR